MATLDTSLTRVGVSFTPNTTVMPIVGSKKYPGLSHPPTKTRITNVRNDSESDGRLTLSSRTFKFPTSANQICGTYSKSGPWSAFFHINNELRNRFDWLPSLMMLVRRYHVLRNSDGDKPASFSIILLINVGEERCSPWICIRRRKSLR